MANTYLQSVQLGAPEKIQINNCASLYGVSAQSVERLRELTVIDPQEFVDSGFMDPNKEPMYDKPVGALKIAAQLLKQLKEEQEAPNAEGYKISCDDPTWIVNSGEFQLRFTDANGNEGKTIWSLEVIECEGEEPSITKSGLLTVPQGSYANIKLTAKSFDDYKNKVSLLSKVGLHSQS